MHADHSDVSRRKLLALLGVGAAAAGVGVVASSVSRSGAPVADATAPAASPQVAAPAVASPATLHPLRNGSAFARWTVHEVGPLETGAVNVTVRGEAGELFHLEVMAKDDAPGAPRAPGESKYFAVYLRNGGDGEQGTLEGHGLAAMTLATIIERNETPESVAPFLSLGQRLSRFPERLGAPGSVAL